MIGKRLVFCLFLMIGLFLVAPSQNALGQIGVVQGTVTDADGKPLEDVLIRIEGMDVARKYEVKTNKEGKYLHAGISLQGVYRIIAEKEGYVSDYVEGLRAGFNREDERGVADFQLRRGETSKLAFELTDEEREEIRRRREEQERQQKKLEAVQELVNQGANAYNAGDFETAVEAFKQATEATPDQPTLWANLGNAYRRLNRHDEAVTAFETAIELDPENAGFYQSLGNLYASKGNADKAQELFEKAVELNKNLSPRDAAVNYYNMGITHINTGNNEAAIAALQAALELDPSHAEAHYQLALTLLGVNQVQEAVEHLQKYVELSPTGPNAEVAKQLIEQLGG